MSLPKPMIVYSGNGLHVYWVLTEELEPQDWKPLANAMKQAALDKEFKNRCRTYSQQCVGAKTCWYTQPKNGNEVKLLVDAEPVEVSALKNLYLISIKMGPGR